MKRRTHNAAKRAQKKARKEAMAKAGLVTGTKSRFAKKVERKRGRGTINPSWMWWMERYAGEAAMASPLPGMAS